MGVRGWGACPVLIFRNISEERSLGVNQDMNFCMRK